MFRRLDLRYPTSITESIYSGTAVVHLSGPMSLCPALRHRLRDQQLTEPITQPAADHTESLVYGRPSVSVPASIIPSVNHTISSDMIITEFFRLLIHFPRTVKRIHLLTIETCSV